MQTSSSGQAAFRMTAPQPFVGNSVLQLQVESCCPHMPSFFVSSCLRAMDVWNAPFPWALLALFTWSIWKGSFVSLLPPNLTELAFTLKSLICSMYGKISGFDASIVFLISKYVFRVVLYIHTSKVRFEIFFCAYQLPKTSRQCSNLTLETKDN